MNQEIFSVLGMLLTVVAILTLAYVATRYLANFKLGKFKTPRSDGHMRVIDQLAVGQDVRLVLVLVGTRFLLLSLSSSGATQLAELSDEEAELWLAELSSDAPTGVSNPSFREAFLASLKERRK